MSTKYTMKFYKGRKLIAETTWDANEAFVDEITHDAEQMIEEAIQCNPPDPPRAAQRTLDGIVPEGMGG